VSAPVVTRPLPGPPRPYRFPSFERLTLPNGLELIIAPVRRLPLTTIRFVLDVGARQEEPELAGVASLTAASLAEGTERLSASALAQEFERLGGALSSYATWDASHVRTTVLSDRLGARCLLTEVVRSRRSHRGNRTSEGRAPGGTAGLRANRVVLPMSVSPALCTTTHRD
jgi:hypothetical protein